MEPFMGSQMGPMGLETPPEPAIDPGMGMAPMAEEPMPEAPLPPVDPLSMALDSILDTPLQDAVRRVYQLATSAARAKADLRRRIDQMDARAYHAALSASPEARYADDLTMARRELDTLAQERRRLTLEAVKARESGRPASIYELQAEAATKGMESVALGVLLFLALPQGLPVNDQQELPNAQ